MEKNKINKDLTQAINRQLNGIFDEFDRHGLNVPGIFCVIIDGHSSDTRAFGNLSTAQSLQLSQWLADQLKLGEFQSKKRN